MTTTSKAELARKLIELGSTKSFNTLRKWSKADLVELVAQLGGNTYVATTAEPVQACIAEQAVSTPVEASPTEQSMVRIVAQDMSHIPTDREIYLAAMSPKVSSMTPPTPVPVNGWMALCMMPFMLLARIFTG